LAMWLSRSACVIVFISSLFSVTASPP
jgi:hypothetical protein